jgi:hypothetical protein
MIRPATRPVHVWLGDEVDILGLLPETIFSALDTRANAI